MHGSVHTIYYITQNYTKLTIYLGYVVTIQNIIWYKLYGNWIFPEGYEMKVIKRRLDAKGFNVLSTLISYNNHKLIHCSLLWFLSVFDSLENNNRYYNQIENTVIIFTIFRKQNFESYKSKDSFKLLWLYRFNNDDKVWSRCFRIEWQSDS